MQIDASRQHVYQTYAKARRRTYSYLSIVGVLFFYFSLLQLPFLGFLHDPGFFSYIVVNARVHAMLQPFDWQPVTSWYPIQVLLYYAAISLALECIYMPAAFQIEYLLPRRFKIGSKTARQTVLNIFKNQGLLVTRWAVLIELFYLCMALQPFFWWGEMALLLLILKAIRQWRSPARLKRLFVVSALPEGELEQRLSAYLKRNSIAAQKIVVIDKPGTRMTANAFILGFGKNRLIAITRTMFNEFTPDEIVVLFVHELGHLMHHDLLRKLLIWFVVLFVGYGIMASAFFTFTFPAPSGAITTIPLFIVAQLLVWMIGSDTFNKFSRRCEYEADEFALQETGLAASFQRAMIRIANTNRVVANPEKNLSTHPSIVSRIQHAQAFIDQVSGMASVNDVKA